MSTIATCFLIGLVSVSGLNFNGLVKYHNAKRVQHHAPSLVWDKTAAKVAKRHACECEFRHSIDSKYGENLYAIFSQNKNETAQVMKSAASDWYSEVKYYNFDAPGWQGGVAGHFTQMVWKATKRIGCGVCWCKKKGMTLLVCSYFPPGNVLGQFAKNVLTASSEQV